MPDATSRPRLRPIETIVVPDPRHGKVLVLRDTQGVTDAHAVVPPPLVPILVRFDGSQSCDEIAAEVSRELGAELPVEVVVRLADELDRGLFLDGPTFREARARVEREFAESKVRPASHAGGAYHADARALATYLDERCLARARPAPPKPNGQGKLVGLIAPHIDPWRGWLGYGHAYGALRDALAPEVDTFILFGTSHAPMREAFALCDKDFATPLGVVPADQSAISVLEKEALFDPYADEFNHKREHSLEFQVVFLRHVLKDRDFRIVPVLAGLGEHQARGTDPAKDDRANRFLDGVRALVEARAGRVVVVAGADMAHVGPRFGDEVPFGAAERAELESRDRRSLSHAADGEAGAFWEHVAGDLETRRVCGLAPIYSLLRTLTGSGKRSHLFHYEQTVDKDDGSIVSHAALGFYE